MSDHESLIRALRSPACYPHAVARVDVHETHISSVVLTGEYVYKIKKPVRFAFVDFATLESRRACCQEEVRLNRRFARDLYVGVVPITGTVDQPRVDGEGEPIEYAVKLRQFDSREELAALLERGEVEPDELRAFGLYLAAIHADTPARRGKSKAWNTVERNLQELGPLPGGVADWLASEHARLQSVLDSRAQTGSVRECHGDLHAGNVVRWQGVLTAFDCIEFSAELRQIDVADDAAFLMMDLQARERRELAYAFINGWLEASGDYDSVQLLRWFRVHRALVRTKVARLERAVQKAELYLRAALRELSTPAPRLIAMSGLSGSGKTWLSTQLLQFIGAIRVRSDVERKRLAGLQAHESSRSLPDTNIYTVEYNDRVYARLMEIARATLRAGEHAIVDAASLRRRERESFIALAAEVGVPLHIVHCRAPDEELRSRLLARTNDASEATVDVLERQHSHWEDFGPRERPYVIDVDTRDTEAVRKLIERLRGSIAVSAKGEPQ